MTWFTSRLAKMLYSAARAEFGDRWHNQRCRRRLVVETLEDRCVPTMITPTTFADGVLGSGSLRDAVLQFNADTGSDDDIILLVTSGVGIADSHSTDETRPVFAVSPFIAPPDRAPLLARPPRADCIVVDLRLPDMDGLALIAALRALGPQPRAILITTNPDDRLRRAASLADIVIVEKPLIGGELRQRIADAVRNRTN